MDSEYMPHFMPTSTYQQVSELLYWWTSTISCQLLFRECLRVGKINMCCYCKENCQQSTVWALVFDWFESIVKVYCFCLYHILCYTHGYDVSLVKAVKWWPTSGQHEQPDTSQAISVITFLSRHWLHLGSLTLISNSAFQCPNVSWTDVQFVLPCGCHLTTGSTIDAI